MEIDQILFGLNDQQKEIVLSNNNLLVKACPGSGKTRTLTYKLAYESLKNAPMLKKMVAITYTNRAAEEIKDRLEKFGQAKKSVWAGTIHQFCLEYIIRPYQMYCDKISKGYSIIDEFVQVQYLQEIATEMKLELKFWDIKKIDTSLDLNMNIKEKKYFKIVEEYHKQLSIHKEIDFDLILNIAYLILKNVPFVKRNIAGIIKDIYIDEYQDTNELQYLIIGMIGSVAPQINVLIVGDLDQAIYGSLGGIAKEKKDIEQLFNKKFVEKSLTGCYRSTQRIIDFYMHFQLKPLNIISKAEWAKDKGNICYSLCQNKDSIYEEIANLIRMQLAKGILENEICVIAPQWEMLFPISRKMKQLLPEVSFDASDITPIKYEEFNIFYKIAKLAFTPIGEKINMRKRLASEILSILSEDYHVFISKDVDCFTVLKAVASMKVMSNKGTEYLKYIVSAILEAIGIELNDYSELKKAYNNYFEKIFDRIEKHDLPDTMEIFMKTFREREGVVITSCHKVKGEEYTTVIAFGLLEGKIPHWDAIYKSQTFARNEARKLLYVIASRAKKNLYLFSESGRKRPAGVYEPTQILLNYSFSYDQL